MEETKCNLCGSSKYKVLYDLRAKVIAPDFGYKITEGENVLSSLRIVSCRHCSLVYVNPQENIERIYKKYAEMQDEVYLSEENGRRRSSRIILKKISRYRRSGRMLEIGCATGFLLDEARRIGWEVYGLDLSSWAVRFAREKLNLKVEDKSLEEVGFTPNYFDAVIVSDVIEHLSDPQKTLQEIRRVLKPTGIIYISTPDIDSLLSKILKARWWGIQQAHLYYFSKKTLSRLLDSSGFKVIAYGSYARVFSVSYWARRLCGYNKFLGGTFKFVSKVLFLQNKLLKISFYDQIELFARKKRSLSSIQDDELPHIPQKKELKTVVVLPAFNAAKTLELTVRDIPKDLVSEIILVDDASLDNTVSVARGLGLKVFTHAKNSGYGANQKTCYLKALESGADIVVMVHPDYQYDPRIIPELIEPIRSGRADAVFGSRMMKGGALEGGMPLWKQNTNILLTAIENIVLGSYLTEYHSGFRAYSSCYLRTVNFMANSDNFVFDNEMVVQGVLHYLRIEEVPIKTRYFEEASTIKFLPSVIYGLGILKTLLKYVAHSKGIVKFKQFE